MVDYEPSLSLDDAPVGLSFETGGIVVAESHLMQFAGDRLSATVTVKYKSGTKRPDRGILTFAIEVHNGRGQVVQEGTNLLMMRTRAPNPADFV